MKKNCMTIKNKKRDKIFVLSSCMEIADINIW